MVEEGAVSIFVEISTSKEEASQVQAIELLTILACEDDAAIKQKVMEEGVLGSLVRVLHLTSPHSSKAKEVALRAIENLCFSSPSSMNYLMSSGFLDRALYLIRSGEISIQQESALKAILAAETLSGMISIQRNRRRFVREDENVDRILELLDPEEKSVTKKFLLAALVSLTDDSTSARGGR
ncbi:hypothetical protein GW17_00042254 [Ensete ventricosum]|nr:hypothetical protein GW17_00042254 [Ensete ventricosum]